MVDRTNERNSEVAKLKLTLPVVQIDTSILFDVSQKTAGFVACQMNQSKGLFMRKICHRYP